jgi:SET domain-containing protein
LGSCRIGLIFTLFPDMATSTRSTSNKKDASASKLRRTSKSAAASKANKYFVLRKSAIQGRGAFATRPIKRGTRIIEYTGERISHALADERYDDGKMGRHHTFLFTIDSKTCIDAAVNGNYARFINHSCAPNCEAIDEKKHIYIEAIRDIAAGEELTYDYAYERDGTEDEEWERLYVCRCGAPTCRGTILAPQKKRGSK